MCAAPQTQSCTADHALQLDDANADSPFLRAGEGNGNGNIVGTGTGVQQAIRSLSRFRSLYAGTSTAETKKRWDNNEHSYGEWHWQREKPLPRISEKRLQQVQAQAHDKDHSTPTTVLYLAYGSNLAASTFLDDRGIRPLAAINVLVPKLDLCFDLPGIPYKEPAFANTRYRKAAPHLNASSDDSSLLGHPVEKEGLSRKPLWKKGLVGVVYEVTPSDYAHIIATEGGGSSYQDILIPCHPLPTGMKVVPENPESLPKAFLAHTLFAPRLEDGGDGAIKRPDPNYGQPSARYLGLLITGSREHDLPADYQAWLQSLHSYRMTTKKQELGAKIFLAIWSPMIATLFALSSQFEDADDGTIPRWFGMLFKMVHTGVWVSYDGVFKAIYGDGERTVGDEEEQWGGTWKEKETEEEKLELR